MPVIEVSNLTKTYSSGGETLTVLDNVSFSLDQGESCAIIGPSGSGKTTLLGLCAGLDVPSSGSISLHGTLLHELNEDERARFRSENIGFVFQSFHLIPTLTALENVLVPLELRGLNPKPKEASDLLRQVGLGERIHHYPSQLSGGEQQRVAIARAFINNPKILFADEPTGNLDEETGGRIVQMLMEMKDRSGTNLILVTHDPALARRAGRLLRFQRGCLVS
jgi:putative ABC transport system ATP-binding protein